MCRTKYHSLAPWPQVGYLAHINLGDGRFARATVTEVSEDRSWVTLVSSLSSKKEYRAILQTFGSYVIPEGEPQHYSLERNRTAGVNFCRIPEVGDTAQFLGGDLEERMQVVTAVSDDGNVLILDDGTWASLAKWGTYQWEGGSRGIMFTPAEKANPLTGAPVHTGHGPCNCND